MKNKKGSNQFSDLIKNLKYIKNYVKIKNVLWHLIKLKYYLVFS